MFPNVLNEWLLMFCMLNKKKIYPAYVSKHDSNCKRQVVLLRDKFNNGYNFVPFISLKQKSAWTSSSAIGEVIYCIIFKYADKSVKQEK